MYNNLAAYSTLVRSLESYQDVGLVKWSMLACISGFLEYVVYGTVYTNEWNRSEQLLASDIAPIWLRGYFKTPAMQCG